jgi:hypothetical protein
MFSIPQIPHLPPFLFTKSTNDAINLRHISEHISSFPKMTKLSVQIQGYIARLFSKFFQLMKSSPEYNNLQYGLACAMKGYNMYIIA